MSAAYLLDANVLIALVLEEHEHHDRAARWAAEVGRVALCPTVEGALVRFLVRAGERAEGVAPVLEALYASSRCEFWPEELSYAAVDLRHVQGHRQVTDAYLASVAIARGGRLATFDRALATVWPEAVELIAQR